MQFDTDKAFEQLTKRLKESGEEVKLPPVSSQAQTTRKKQVKPHWLISIAAFLLIIFLLLYFAFA